MRLMFLLVVAVFCNCKSKENPNLTSIGNTADLTVTLTSPMEPQQNPTTEYPYAKMTKTRRIAQTIFCPNPINQP